MPTLITELRNKLERVIVEARDAAEAGARTALEAMAVHHHEPYPHMNPAQRKLRNHLRTRARQLGDRQEKSGRLDINHLVGECAYEHWHRMLFARFLIENYLLIHPKMSVAMSLDEAKQEAEAHGVDVWVFASRCAQGMLPQIFRPEDPLLQITFAREHQLKLEGLLTSLSQAVFTASDALGWVYQFWQGKKKDEINRSEVKIGADELPAVTQIFTEPYMVEFLLHNTIGAWWAGKKLTAEDAASAKSEDDLRRKLALPGVDWEYLRFTRGSDGTSGVWRPAAGSFDGWPNSAAEIKMLDPCCGSGHFLVAALHHLVPIRMAEEDISAEEAIDAVLSENLHGLEIDERCCQIAVFAVVLAAWTYPHSVGFRPLPELQIACTGKGPQSTEEQWLKLSERSCISMPSLGRDTIKNGLLNMHRIFSQAPTLGSLINTTEISSDLISPNYETIKPYLLSILSAETIDDETREITIAATGMVKAADLLTRKYTLVSTNVPYLGRGKQDDLLKKFIETHFSEGKADLAMAFMLRGLEFCTEHGTIALVTPQSWLFLTRYKKLRKTLLRRCLWNSVVRLGPNAFQNMNWWAATTALVVLSHCKPDSGWQMIGIDVSGDKQQMAKAAMLRGDLPAEITVVSQSKQLKNPDARIQFTINAEITALSNFADSYQGIGTSDNAQFLFCFWEIARVTTDHKFVQVSPERTDIVSGATKILIWENGTGRYYQHAMRLKSEGRLGGWKSGGEAWGKDGIAIKVTGVPTFSRYLGTMFDTTVAVVIPKEPGHLPAIEAFIRSEDYIGLVRAADQAVSITEHSFLKVPFDRNQWQKEAAKKFPSGLPEPESDDPTQWLFHGWPYRSSAPLQVAVARLLGYRWPSEFDDKMRFSNQARALVKRCNDLIKFADDDGIVCIPSVRGEEPATERLLELLLACGFKPGNLHELTGGVDLENWFRNSFFGEHCKLFQNRPFVWHIWDGRNRDGFHALVNYHKLAEGNGRGRKVLESLTYSYLGDWINRQKDEVRRGEGGAEDRLAAAVELQKRLIAILKGEPPFDIFVRWKPLHKQPIGWEPDINDGVRVNIRPFLASDLPNGRKGAGVLRFKPNIKWAKDRGKEPERPKAEYPWFWGWDEKTEDFMGNNKFDGNRWNACHYTHKVKQAARDALAKGGR